MIGTQNLQIAWNVLLIALAIQEYHTHGCPPRAMLCQKHVMLFQWPKCAPLCGVVCHLSPHTLGHVLCLRKCWLLTINREERKDSYPKILTVSVGQDLIKWLFWFVVVGWLVLGFLLFFYSMAYISQAILQLYVLSLVSYRPCLWC